ncbi:MULTISPECIES: NAD(P)/FAD-dependent oxidoreductase [Rhodococcus]|uniref:NAD(P)/FAD-dependent oxidoreductase n=1 Tax=Rhodococcus TaxID=1827 RepID=UPI00071E427F|nr:MULTISPECIES: FAD-dependent oxidoreductase [Rhodococcus]KSU69548.1 amino acid dehydrogenase [Rhodococcus qingshengii]OFE09622.1 amino acid dehydrogenase [Rhodococcus sp. 1139]SCC65959.1 D-amino-acid dehydrogenase [Rhodococcus qingshengii]
MGTRQSPDRVVVVGAGVVGLSTAWFLQERGVEVTVVDRDGVAADASWGNAGWLAPALTLPLPEPAVLQYGLRAMLSPSSPVYVPLTTDLKLIRFLVGFARHCAQSKWQEAMSVYTEVNRTALGAYDELADGGVKELTRLADPFLAAFASEKDRQTLVDEFHHVEAAGGEVDFDLLDYDAIHSLEPSLGQGVKAGLRLRNQRFIDPPLFVNSLADAVRERGGEIVSGFDVTQIDDRVGGVTVRSAHGDSRDGDSVVISSGARLNKLAAPFGVRKLVQAGRGYSFSVKPEHLPKNPVYFPTQRVACTPLHDRFRVAGMMEFRSPDAPLDPRRVQAIIDAAKPMLSGIDWTAREEEWVGSRPCTTDGLPLIGATKSPRVHVAGGHGMWGIALGPLTGKMVADSMTGAQTPTVMRHFDPLR